MKPPERIIGYLPKGYPRISETFVSNEILFLERQGLGVEIFSLKRPEPHHRQPSALAVRARVTYLPDRVVAVLPWLLPVHVALGLRRPRRYARTLRWCLSRCWRERSTTTLRRFLQAGWLVGFVLRGRRIPHFHAHFCHGSATVAMFVKWLTGSTYSFTAHAKDLYLADPDLLRLKMQESEFVVTCTEHNRRHLEEIGGGAVPVVRIYHGVDLGRFGAPPPAEPRAAAPGPPRILSVGRLVEKKGFDTLIHACALLRDRGQRFHCRIVGDGPLAGELHEQVRALGLDGKVELSGSLLQDDLVGEYARADVFALACQVLENGDRDGLPNVLVEAQACGLPVVSTAISGIPELIEPGVNGLLVPPGDPAALAGALAQLLDDATLRQRFGSAGRQRVRAEFDLERNTRRLRELFRRWVVLPDLEPAVARAEVAAPEGAAALGEGF
jgi:glycosyltransferase involved in cell wall biosynthesis